MGAFLRKWEGADLKDVNLKDVNLKDVNLKDPSLWAANLEGANANAPTPPLGWDGIFCYTLGKARKIMMIGKHRISRQYCAPL